MSKQDRNTPESVLDPVRSFYGGVIPLDPCSNKWSRVDALRSYTVEDDGLAQSWDDDAFINPPWGRGDIIQWARKGVAEFHAHHRQQLFWLPCYPETRYSKLLYRHCTAVCFWGERVNHPCHGKLDSGSMWPTQLIYLGARFDEFCDVFGDHGTVMQVMAPHRALLE